MTHIDLRGAHFADEADLEVVGSARRGGTGRVFEVILYGQRYLCKQYDDAVRVDLDVPQLRQMLRWRERLSEDERSHLDQRAAWPRRLVHDGRSVTGVLMDMADQGFHEVGRDGQQKPRHLTRLTRGMEEARSYYELPAKLARLAHLGQLMQFLHERAVVIGDLQPNNVLTTSPWHDAAIYLLDCDSVVLAGMSALPQVDPPLYKPLVERPFDVGTDYYKFSTLTVRCLQEQNDVWDCEDARANLVMKRRDLELVRRALAGEMVERDVDRWASLYRTWRMSSRAGQLYRRTDEFEKQVWPGLAVLEAHATRGR